MDFERQTPVTVQAFHYDLVDEDTEPKSDVRTGIQKLDVSQDDEHSEAVSYTHLTLPTT